MSFTAPLPAMAIEAAVALILLGTSNRHRVSEEPPRAAFLACAEQLWPGMLSLQIENVGLSHIAEMAPC
jgi:hypothetical protein